MESSPSITTLPYELIHDINFYLEKSDLLAFRLAIPNGTVSAATAAILFQTITFHLGNHVNSYEKLISRSKYVDRLSDPSSPAGDRLQALSGINLSHKPGVNTSDGIFRYTRKLVVDIRHPFVVDEEAIRCQMEESYVTLMQGDLKPYEVYVKPEEGDLFLDTVEAVLQIVQRRLNVVRVKLSDVMVYEQSKRLLSMVCRPAASRPYSLSIMHAFRTLIDLDIWLGLIRDCDNLDLWFGTWSSLALRDDGIDDVVKALGRCPNIKGFGLLTGANPLTDKAAKKIWDALGQMESLERLDLETVDRNLLDSTPSFKGKNLKMLRLIREGNPSKDTGPLRVRNTLRAISRAGNQLEKLTLTKYTLGIHLELMRQTTIIDLGIRSKYGLLDPGADAAGFWQEVIPVLAPKLKRLRVYSGPYSRAADWSWFDYDNNMAKLALRKCKNLEEVTVSCWEGEIWYLGPEKIFILEMMEDLMVHCPKLRKLNTVFCCGDLDKQRVDTDELLGGWKSTGDLSRVLFGRDFEVAHCREFPAFLYGRREVKGEMRPLNWDYSSRKWKLVKDIENGEKVYALKRLEDEYCFYE